MMNIIADLIRQWGVKKVLEALIENLRKSRETADRDLSDDLKRALKRYCERTND